MIIIITSSRSISKSRSSSGGYSSTVLSTVKDLQCPRSTAMIPSFTSLCRSSEGLCEQSASVSRVAAGGDESRGDGGSERPPTTGHPQGHR